MHDYSRDIMLSKTQEQIELKVNVQTEVDYFTELKNVISVRIDIIKLNLKNCFF